MKEDVTSDTLPTLHNSHQFFRYLLPKGGGFHKKFSLATSESERTLSYFSPLSTKRSEHDRLQIQGGHFGPSHECEKSLTEYTNLWLHSSLQYARHLGRK